MRNKIADFYKNNKEHLFRYTLSILKDSEEAADVVHTVFLKIWKLAQDNEKILENLKAYAFKSVRNEALSRIRIQKTELKLPVFIVESKATVTPDRLILYRDLEDAFKILNSEEQEIVFLRVICSNSFRTISRILELKIFTLTSMYYRAMKKLKKKMGKKCDES